MRGQRTFPCVALLFGIAISIMLAAPALEAAIHVGSSAWVWQNPLPQGDTLNAISCFTTTNCIAVGNNGTILVTTDGGSSWTSSPSVTTVTLRAISCANTTNCTAVGDFGEIITTTDGGAAWAVQGSGTSAQLLGINCDLGGSRCFAVGLDIVLLTTNGGANWSPVAAAPASGSMNGISCPTTIGPVATCFAESGASGQAFLTSNTGFSWTTQFTPSNGPLSAISCATVTACVAVANDLFTLRDSVVVTSNGGNAWKLVTVNHGAHLNSVSCVGSTSFCVAVGGSQTAYFTTNGGSSWTAEANGILSGEIGLNGVSCPSTTTCFAVGDKGAITKTVTGGVTWTSLQTSVTNDSLSLSGVSCPSEGICYIVGEGGILGTTNGGSTWVKLFAAAPQAISCPTTTVCFAVGGDLILATTNSGATWVSQVPPVSGAGLVTVSCPSTSVCFAAGSVVLATTNGGATWKLEPFPAGSVLGISCSSTTTCVAVGGGGTISRTTDGLHWTQEPKLTTAGLHGVSCPNTTDCIVVGDSGTILASTNGGVSWSGQASHTTSDFASVSCVSSNLVTPACDAGTFSSEIFIGAGTWTKDAQLEPFGPLALGCGGFAGIPSNFRCIAAGESGIIASKLVATRIVIGTGDLTPTHGNTEVGQPATFSLTWTVPSNLVWRDLDFVELKLVDDDGAVAVWVRFIPGLPTSVFALLDANGNIVSVGEPGAPGLLDSPNATLDLSASSFQGTGLTGPSVTVNFVVTFKPSAGGNGVSSAAAHVYDVDISAADLNGTFQGPEKVGSWVVRP